MSVLSQLHQPLVHQGLKLDDHHFNFIYMAGLDRQLS